MRPARRRHSRAIDGEALAAAFDEIALDPTSAGFALQPSDYAELFQLAIAPRTVRRPEQRGVRVRIYGPLEARLQHVDRVVLGGLVEGTWPPQTRPDPWLSRPMRHTLGLDLPERRISLSAHDFAQALGASEVILSYPAKLSGAPTVVSRFVQRLAAVAGEARWTAARQRGAAYCRWARALDLPAKVERIDRPEPKPPRAARPTSLSVTQIEAWLRDPYTIYARHVLRLRELDAIDLPPGAADRGTLIHGAVGDFTAAHAAGLPDDPEAALLEFSREYFRRARRLSGGERVLAPALPKDRALVCRVGAGAASDAQGAARRSPRRDQDPGGRARVQAGARSPTASSSTPTAATRSSTTRPARRRPRSRCASAWRRS